MYLLIDGYNLLNAAAITGKGSGPGGFERSRLALLDFLADTVDPTMLPHTTVVFDSQGAPPGLPKGFEHRRIVVRFAAGYDCADTLIEELIVEATSPRQLTVVSSDHRIQRAAHRRRATAVDSEVWYAQTLRNRQSRKPLAVPPPMPLVEDDVLKWLEQFGGEAALQELIEQQEAESSPAAPPDEPAAAPTPSVPDEKDVPMENPFPPGYGEDLLMEPEDDAANPVPPGYGDD
jgi:uncharacterized protein